VFGIPNFVPLFGLIFLIVTGARALGLVWPRLGKRVLKPLWPGQFADPHQKQLVTRYQMMWLSSQGLLCLNLILVDVEKQNGGIWSVLHLIVMLLMVYFLLQSYHLYKQLPQSLQSPPLSDNFIVFMMAGTFAALIVHVVGTTLLLRAEVDQQLVQVIIDGLVVVCLIIPLIATSRKRQQQ
jgi:hypothetical protein